MTAVTAADIDAWRRDLQEEGDGEFLDPTTAQVIAPRLMDEVQRLQSELARVRRDVAAQEAAALERRLGDLAVSGGECETCHNTEARAAMARLRKVAGA